ncbi:MAG: phosphatase PAP2 family protein [Gammaproteobacteria bacterium]|nr:phosphatase PAP2 family protein [Gammaproteobacteria bacterium]
MGQFATGEIKSATGRQRPNSKDSESFLSGHVSAVSAQAEMAKINIEYMPVNKTSKQALSFTVDSFAALTGWARIEAGEHYPTDVLAAWAFGHFVSRMGQEFIDPERQQFMIRPKTGPDTTGIELIIKF